MHRTSEVLLPFCVTNLCSFQYVPVVCACLLVQYVDFFTIYRNFTSSFVSLSCIVQSCVNSNVIIEAIVPLFVIR